MGATASGNVATAADKQAVFIIQTGAAREKLLASAAALQVPETLNGVGVAGGVIYAAFSQDAATDEAAEFDPVGFSAGDLIDANVDAVTSQLVITVNGAEVFRSTSAASVAAQSGCLLYYK